MVSATPVSTLTTVTDFLLRIAQLGPTVIKAAEDAKPFAQALIDAFHGRTMTDAQIEALEAELDDLSEQLQKPLPPADGTTDT